MEQMIILSFIKGARRAGGRPLSSEWYVYSCRDCAQELYITPVGLFMIRVPHTC